ncbi:sensor histidine kinase [Clostridium estertheticum]|uniref:sensor histidine kinase n=1 Tax=Clostridium estertheticum TaxID=238834 RepID=UPI00124E4701|nr:GHKL domain-containing protein [Clostridium estertheticum]MBZ9618523.1 GHKL domain-containing protein [Clostridium estertheticum subsp. laramiense]WAG76449.1 GHKL domain-containing protein [Clostridium estertheticum]
MAIINLFLLNLYFYTCLYIAYKLNNCKIHIAKKNILIIFFLAIIYDYALKQIFFNKFKIVVTFIFITSIIINTIKKKNSILIKTSFFTLSITIISELVITIGLAKFTSISLNNVFTNSMIKFFINILIDINAIFIINLAMIITNLFKAKKEFIISSVTMNAIFFISITVILLFNYSFINQHFSEYFNKKIIEVFIIGFFYFVIPVIFLFINYISNNKTRMMQIKDDEYNKLRLYSEITESLVDDISKFKHDYNNIIFMMNGYIENNDFNGLKKFFSKKIFNEHNIYDFFKLKKIKDSGFKGLLAAKMSQIVKDDIIVSLEILNDIDLLYIDTLDLCRIIGILLDNAREAAKKCNEGFIAISIIQDGSLNITISNNYIDKINITNISIKGYSSKGPNRGIGLSIVNNILNENYPNVLLNSSIENHMFIQDLLIEPS